MNRIFYFLRFSMVFILLVFTTSCNKEKAEAIKIAAENFKTEAVSALEKIKNLFTQSLTTSFEEGERIEEIAKDLEKTDAINAEKLSFIIQEPEIGTKAVAKVEKEFEELENSYYQFERMFQSLPEGSFFAADAVRKAEKHAIELTLQMINFTEFLKEYPVQFTAQRTLILEKIAEAKKIQDKNQRKERLSIISKEIVQLSKEEKAAKQEAITQCLKAAESGKLVAQLIRDYESFSVNDMLVSINTTFSFISELGVTSQSMDSLLKNYKKVETTIRNDPYWSKLLNEKIKP